MRVGFNLAKQKVFSKEKPLVVVLSEGEHVMEGSWTDSDSYVRENTLGITCSDITFVGQSKDKTTVHDRLKFIQRDKFHHDPSLLWFMTTKIMMMISTRTTVAKFYHNSHRHLVGS